MINTAACTVLLKSKSEGTTPLRKVPPPFPNSPAK